MKRSTARVISGFKTNIQRGGTLPRAGDRLKVKVIVEYVVNEASWALVYI